MIPVTNENYIIFNLDKKSDNIKEQLRIKLLYNLYISNKLPINVKNRCCNFSLLETKCNEYNKVLV